MKHYVVTRTIAKCIQGPMVGQMDGWVGWWMWIDTCTCRWMDGWVDGWLDGWMMDGYT